MKSIFSFKELLTHSFMAIQATISFLPSQPSQFLFGSRFVRPSLYPKLNSTGRNLERNKFNICPRSSRDGDEEFLIDAPVSIGDGFSFSGGKYSEGPSQSDEWFRQGKIVKAHPVLGTGEKAKDPIFGLTMSASSQASADVFRVYQLKHALYPCCCAIDGFALKVEVLLILRLF